jgi:AAA domain
LIPNAVQLADAGQLQALVRVAKDFDVVVIDTLARTSAGLEENSAKDMGVYMNNCYKIRDAAREAGATVLVVHHTGYDTRRARGSSALFANGDGEILIESDDPHEHMTMTVKKRRDGEAGQQLHMQLDTVDCGEWTSCVVQGTDDPGPRLTNAEKVLDAIRDGAATQAEITDATGLDKGTVGRELRKLLDAG